MRLNKQGENNHFPRCLDAATTATPNYRLEFYVRVSDILLSLAVTDISSFPRTYQKFVIQGAWLTPLHPGKYNYRYIDIDDNNRVLESGQVIIEDTNHTTVENTITETFRANAAG